MVRTTSTRGPYNQTFKVAFGRRDCGAARQRSASDNVLNGLLRLWLIDDLLIAALRLLDMNFGHCDLSLRPSPFARRRLAEPRHHVPRADFISRASPKIIGFNSLPAWLPGYLRISQ